MPMLEVNGLKTQFFTQDGVVKAGDVLKVDGFINHRLDVALLNQLGAEFHRLYEGCGVNKILTIESSGIGIACLTAQFFNCPVVFAKKSRSRNISADVYTASAESFTYGTLYDAVVSKEYLAPLDRLLIPC